MVVTMEQHALLMAWIFAVGGCVGSFLNVVIYRIPAGLSIVSPGSRCPKCLTPIRARDNVPILSWLLLRGKCRDCGLPISGRYPSIEALVATLFLLLYVADIYLGNAAMLIGVADDSLLPTPGEMWAVFLLHAMLVSSLVAAAMIEFDGHSVPARLFFASIVLRLVVWVSLPRVQSTTGIAAWLLIAVAVAISYLLNRGHSDRSSSGKNADQKGRTATGNHSSRPSSADKRSDPHRQAASTSPWAWACAMLAVVTIAGSAGSLWILAITLAGLTCSRGLRWANRTRQHVPFAILALAVVVGLPTAGLAIKRLTSAWAGDKISQPASISTRGMYAVRSQTNSSNTLTTIATYQAGEKA
jgi:prepilin signal peptidase PulO-like enzyme (type II secretory pathway)